MRKGNQKESTHITEVTKDFDRKFTMSLQFSVFKKADGILADLKKESVSF